MKRALKILVVTALTVLACSSFAACSQRTLSAPSGFTVTDEILRWGSVNNAVSYEVTVDEDSPLRVPDNEFSLVYLRGRGEVNITVKAVAKRNYTDSGYSEPFIYVATGTLIKPQNAAVDYENRLAYWDEVNNALYYEVQIDDGEIIETEEISFDFDEDLSAGWHTFKVRAVGDGVHYGDSPFYTEEFLVFDRTAETAGLGFKYLSDLDAYEVYRGSMTGEFVVIPEEHNGKAVKCIADYGFSGMTEITAAIIPDSVISIGNRAFMDCGQLTEIVMSENLESLGLSVFDNTAYKENLPDGAHYFGKVFYTYEGVISVSQSIEVEDGTLSVAPRAFEDQSYMTAVLLPPSIKSIGDFAFSSCDALEDINFPVSIEVIGGYAFNGCGTLNGSLTLPNVYYIGDGAFRDCAGLTDIILPDGVKHIGSAAFYGCVNLQDIGSSLDGLEFIGAQAFEGTAFYDGLAAGPVYFGKVLYRYKDLEPSTAYEVEDGTLSVADGAFASCLGLTEISVPDSVVYIGASAFSGCSDLETVNFGEGVAKIGNSAFKGCSMLAVINLPDSLTSIGSSAFYECFSLSGIVIPAQVSVIEENTFFNCMTISSVVLGANIVSVIDGAFMGCSALATVTVMRPLSEGLTTLDDDCFNGCNLLNSIIISDPASLDAYKAAPGWQNYSDIMKTEV